MKGDFIMTTFFMAIIFIVFTAPVIALFLWIADSNMQYFHDSLFPEDKETRELNKKTEKSR